MAGDYLYVNAFDDVNGWDLQHARRVRWCRLPAEHAFGGAAFGANPPRCSRVWNEEVLDFAEGFVKSPPTHWKTAPSRSCPPRQGERHRDVFCANDPGCTASNWDQ